MSRPVNPELCKHADSLIVQRNHGYRWVTCTECHTDFLPEPDLPENPRLYVEYHEDDGMWGLTNSYRPAIFAEILAVVRRGVESGTIEGEEFKVTMMEVEGAGLPYKIQTPIMVPPGTYLVIPASDRGEDR